MIATHGSCRTCAGDPRGLSERNQGVSYDALSPKARCFSVREGPRLAWHGITHQELFLLFLKERFQPVEVKTTLLKELLEVRTSLGIQVQPEEFLGVGSAHDPLDISLLDGLRERGELRQHHVPVDVKNLDVDG